MDEFTEIIGAVNHVSNTSKEDKTSSFITNIDSGLAMELGILDKLAWYKFRNRKATKLRIMYLSATASALVSAAKRCINDQTELETLLLDNAEKRYDELFYDMSKKKMPRLTAKDYISIGLGILSVFTVIKVFKK